jgi:hypothetical protein
MGFGDELLGAGLARGAAARGKRAALGDGNRIIWHNNAHEIFSGNPHVAAPGDEGAADIEWIEHYPGARAYARMEKNRTWCFNPAFRAVPGEIFLTEDEDRVADQVAPGFAVIEPNVKRLAPNKQWPQDRYQAVCVWLVDRGIKVIQFDHGAFKLRGACHVRSPHFRHALALLKRAALYIGPEGGLHHGAAALNIPAIVIFGGFIAPQVTGYDDHVNLFTGTDLGCGHVDRCSHCDDCMKRITAEQVIEAAKERLLSCQS